MATITHRIIHIMVAGAIFATALLALGCGGSSSTNAVANDSPTEAYKRLFAAVKSKDINAIKNEMSKQSNALVSSISSMQKKSVEEIYLNGLTSSLKSETLPEIRDERVNGDMGAVEVYNSGMHKWEDVPFIDEDGRWKLALGDELKGSYKSPGKGRDQKEREAANVLSNMNSGPSKTGPVATSNSTATAGNDRTVPQKTSPANSK